MKATLRAVAFILGTAFRADPVRATGTLVLRLSDAAGDALFALWLKMMTDAIVRGDLRAATVAAGASAATLGTIALSGWMGFTLRMGLDERTAHAIDRRILTTTTTLAGLEHHERPEYLDRVETLRLRQREMSTAVGSVIETIGVLVRLASTAILLGRLHPLLLLLPALGLPSLAASGFAQRMNERAIERTTANLREADRLFELATRAAHAKELRLFGSGPAIARRHDALMRDLEDRKARAGLAGAALTSGGWLVFAAAYAGAVAFVASRAISGEATPGDVALTIALASQMNNQVAGVVTMLSWLAGAMRVVGHALWLEDYARAATGAAGDAPVPSRISEGIRLQGVGFRYPGTEAWVLRGVDLRIPAGSTVAIVGDNGAGKTTLVKLLCRFYEPTEGTITLDGAAISSFDPAQWRRRMSAGFQDFARLEAVARETVGIGELPHIDDEPLVLAALGRAGAQDIVGSLSDGLGTPLGRSFDDGAELSGGQWQKLALGRAMMREDPLILVLDEPTASLDAQTEHALFERYAGAARRAADAGGAITLLVSHRFSTVRMADLIVVVAGGRVVEHGSHADLVRRAGLYAELYELQARAYR